MSIYITDTETTGFARTDEVIQLAYIKIKDNKTSIWAHDITTPINEDCEFVEKIFVQNYYPNVRVNSHAQKVHGLSKLRLTGSPNSNTVKLPEDINLIIGHKVDFDIGKLARTDEKVTELRKICTISLVKKIEQIQGGKFGLENYKLKTMVQHFYPDLPITEENLHNALYDCELTLLLIIAIWKNFPFLHTLSDFEKYFFAEK